MLLLLMDGGWGAYNMPRYIINYNLRHRDGKPSSRMEGANEEDIMDYMIILCEVWSWLINCCLFVCLGDK
jgi:hypothetical protein